METIVLCFLLEDRDFRFQVRRLNIGDQAPFETRAQALFDRVDVLRQAVRGNNDLLLLLVQRIEGVKELFLGAFLAGNELDVVDEQDVHGVETVAEADHAIEAQGVDDLDGELFRADIAETHGRIALLDGVPNGMHQVRFAHAHAAIKEQRVVSLGRLFGHGARSSMRKLIGLADDERIEGVPEIELVVAALKIQLGLLGGGNDRSGRHGFLFSADVLHLHGGSAHLVEDRLHNLAVSPSEDLTENRGGDLNVDGIALAAVQPGRLEPGVVGVDAYSGLDEIEELVPDVLLSVALSPDLSSRYHRIGKSQSRAISTAVNKLWKAKFCPKASRFGVRARTGKIHVCPYGFPRGLQTCMTTLST